MTSNQPLIAKDIEAGNERSLSTLIRAITLSQDQFALILVRCNYTQLRDRITQELQTRLPFPIHTLTLPESAKTLYTTIQTAIGKEDGEREAGGEEQPPRALLIFGLEALEDLDQALVATNVVREELRKQFRFPLVFWVNDDVLRQLERLAPDLSSWAGNAIIEFELAIPELVRSLRTHSNRLFNSILSMGDEQFWAIWQITPAATLRPGELQFALSDLQASSYTIAPDLQASLDFLLGQNAHSQGEMETARELYGRSLAFWLQHLNEDEKGHEERHEARGGGTEGKRQKDESKNSSFIPHPSSFTPSSPSPPRPLPPVPYLERAACLLFYLGLWWRSYAVLQRAAYRSANTQAHHYFQQSLALFTRENRQDLVARFIIAQAETLQKLERWDELDTLARQAIVLHQLYKDPVRQARDRGFLAEVALVRSDWQYAKQQVEIALQILTNAEADLQASEQPPDPPLEMSLDLAQRYHYGWYLFLLAKAEKELGNLEAAIRHLETARDSSHPQNDPPLYIQILRQLRSYYFEKGEYQLAFRTRQARRLIEHQYGYRAFVGALRLQPQQLSAAPLPLPAQIDQQRLLAQEITASGRQKDLNELLIRLSQAQYKLIVIHGPSGVGKSSIVSAGLIPILMEQTFEGRVVLPSLLDFYGDWQTALSRILTSMLQSQGLEVKSQALGESSTAALSLLRQATDQNFLPVLLFDQFEEFFFAYDAIADRIPFYQFLSDCLNLPFVKVVLSLREDYLHHLLQFQRYASLDIINNDILSKQIRYPLEDLTPEDAKAVIKSLTEKAQFFLEDDLIDELVRDLAGDWGQVRPIELQVVGAQLQAEGINTLAEYRQQGPKEKLVQRSLEDVVADCGPENEDIARIILFLLTNENGTRPLKTQDDLEADLVDLGLTPAIAKLDLVLEVLVSSGLVFLIPDAPCGRYQLVHDYLVSFIRQEQESQVSNLQAELQQEREQRRDAEERLKVELQQRLTAEKRLSIALKQQLRRSRVLMVISAVTLVLLAVLKVTK